MTEDDDPERNIKGRSQETSVIENNGDYTHGFLGIVHTVTQAVYCRGYKLQLAEYLV